MGGMGGISLLLACRFLLLGQLLEGDVHPMFINARFVRQLVQNVGV